MSRVRPPGSTKASKRDKRRQLTEELRGTYARHRQTSRNEECRIADAGYVWFDTQSPLFKQLYAKWIRTSDPQIKDAMWNAMLAEHREFEGLPSQTRELQSNQPWGSSSAGEELYALAVLSNVKQERATPGVSHKLACERVTAKMGLVNPDLDQPFEAGRQHIGRLQKSFAGRIDGLSLKHEVQCLMFTGLQRAQVRTDCLYARLVWAMLPIAVRSGNDGKAYLNTLRLRTEDKARRRRRFRRRRSRIRPRGRDQLRILVRHFKVKDLRAKVARYWAEHGHNLAGNLRAEPPTIPDRG